MKQLFIFDLDGTLYDECNPISKIIDERIKNYIKQERNLTENEYKNLEKNIPDLLTALSKLKIDKNKFYEEVYKNINYNEYFDKNEKLKNELSKLNGKKIICSNSCEYHVNEILKTLGIAKLFDNIYCTDKHKNKFEIYKKIVEKYKLSPEQIYVIGDNYMVDIEPAYSLGFKTLYIKNGSEISNIEDALKKINYEKEKN